MFVVKIRCKCGNWVTLRAANRPGSIGNESAEKSCWLCKPYASKVSAHRGGGHIKGFINDIEVLPHRVDVVSDEP